MKIRKMILFLLLGLLLVFGAVSLGMAQDISSATPSVLNIHEFLVYDLGLTGGGRDYELFRLTFAPGAGNLKLFIEVETAGGDKLLNGATDLHDYASTFAGKTYYNYDILDKLGGSFEITSVIPTRIQDAILNTGGVPQGAFRMTFQLRDSGDTPVGTQRVILINVGPLYLLTLAPSDNELVNKQKLNFVWMTNLERLRLDIFDRPTGGSAIAWTRVTGRSHKWPELVAKAGLQNGETYYWQIAGYKITTHGDVKVTGPRSPFMYYEGKIPEDLTALDAGAIKAALEKVGVTGLSALQLKWVMYDDSAVFITDPITSALNCLAESDIDYSVRWE
jgi:hypothetical protein